MAALKVWDGSQWVTIPSGGGLPTGGTTGQFLRKTSGTNYDTAFATPLASEVSFSPTGSIAATNVQTAIAEVASEYPSNGSWTAFTPTFTNGITANGNASFQARYKLIGDKTILVQLIFLSGTTTTTNANTVTMATPTGTIRASTVGAPVIGVGTSNSSVGNVVSYAQVTSTPSIVFARATSTTDGTIVALSGTNIASAGQGLNICFTYELT